MYVGKFQYSGFILSGILLHEFGEEIGLKDTLCTRRSNAANRARLTVGFLGRCSDTEISRALAIFNVGNGAYW